MKKPRVLIITNLFPNPAEPNRGVFVAQLVERMAARLDISVISPLPWFPKWLWLSRIPRWGMFARIPQAATVRGIAVTYPRFLALPRLGAFHAVALFAALWPIVRAEHRRRPIDALNVHWVFPDGVAVSWIGRRLGIPVVLSAHGCDINDYAQYRLRRPQIRGALKRADRITAVSAAQETRMRELTAVNGKVRVIHNGVDQARFHQEDRASARQALKVDSGTPIILFVGQFVPVKRFEDLIRAAGRLRALRGNGFRVIAIGEGPLRKACMQEVARQGLSAQFTFHGERPYDEVSRWMAACDVLCLPSEREGCPAVVVEALACGRPVVASRVGGIPELIQEGVNGLLCPPGDPEALARRLAEALDRAWDAATIRASVKHLTWEAAAERYLEVIEEARAASKRTAG